MAIAVRQLTQNISRRISRRASRQTGPAAVTSRTDGIEYRTGNRCAGSCPGQLGTPRHARFGGNSAGPLRRPSSSRCRTRSHTAVEGGRPAVAGWRRWRRARSGRLTLLSAVSKVARRLPYGAPVATADWTSAQAATRGGARASQRWRQCRGCWTTAHSSTARASLANCSARRFEMALNASTNGARTCGSSKRRRRSARDPAWLQRGVAIRRAVHCSRTTSNVERTTSQGRSAASCPMTWTPKSAIVYEILHAAGTGALKSYARR
jgi:hypothetical protein